MKRKNDNIFDIIWTSHSLKVAALVKQILLKFGYSEEDAMTFAAYAAFHDIGKFFVSDDILNKPGRLTETEYREIQKHTRLGSELLEALYPSKYPGLAQIAAMHHERADGRGYPAGLTEANTPLEAQVAGVADAYEALCSKRSYKERIDPDEALDIILDGRCGNFSYKILDCIQEFDMKMLMSVIVESDTMYDSELLSKIEAIMLDADTSVQIDPA